MMMWCLIVYLKFWDTNFIMDIKIENMVLQVLLPYLKDLCIMGDLAFLALFLEPPLIFNEQAI